MSAMLKKNATPIPELLPISPEPGHPVHGFQLAVEKAGNSESQPPQLTGDWQKREDGERRDTEEEVWVRNLMEDVKRYIRSIDISTL